MTAVTVPPSIGPADRFSLTFCLAIIIHAILILGITFAPEEKLQQRFNTMEIILVQQKSLTTPDEAELLAQASLEGGGASEEKINPATPITPPFPAQNPEITAPPPTQKVPPPEQPTAQIEKETKKTNIPPVKEIDPESLQPIETEKEILHVQSPHADNTIEPPLNNAQTQIPDVVEKTKPAEEIPHKEATKKDKKPLNKPQLIEKPPLPSAASLLSNSFKIASLSAEIRRKLESKAKRPKRKFVSASTKEFKYANYMEAWRSKVERVGNLNYPDEARRRKLSGSLIMDVALYPDGSIVEITIRKSSGHKILDDAAIRIVELAAPFAEFPDNIKADTDILHITRTWQFINSKGFR